MEPKTLVEILEVIGRLKDITRHCDTPQGRQESAAEHSYRLATMACLVRDVFPELDFEKLVTLCLIHDIGEAFTGDIASFRKTAEDIEKENKAYLTWLSSLPAPYNDTWKGLVEELLRLSSPEAKVCHALDQLEALISHNEDRLANWLPLEYDLQLTYGNESVTCSEYLIELREEVRKDSENKIQNGL